MSTIAEDPLIEASTLAALPADAVCVVDCRFALADPAQGRRDYLAGHLPGAVYAHLDDDLSALPSADPGLGRHPLPAAATLTAALQRWGWRPGLTVVAYDAAGGALAAARLWWLLQHMAGIPTRVLDGGLAAWIAAGGRLQQGAVEPAAGAATLRLSAARLLDTAALQAALAGHAVCLLDARAAPRYRGDEEPLDRVGGHVPGARNRPFADNLDADGRFRPVAQLRAGFQAQIGDRDPRQVVHMCGSGVTACHNLLAMEHAGLRGSRLYAPSWSGWVADPSRPVARGEAAGG